MKDRLEGTPREHLSHLRHSLIPTVRVPFFTAAEADFLPFTSLDLADDLSSNDTDLLGANGVLTPRYVYMDASLHYIPTSFSDQLTPAFLHGYIVVVQAALRILLEDFSEGGACVPSVEAVQKGVDAMLEAGEIPPPVVRKGSSSGGDGDSTPKGTDTENDPEDASEAQPASIAVLKTYVQAGGKVSYALNAIIDNARRGSPVGEEYTSDEKARQAEEDYAKEVAHLPECANDFAFDLVREKLGLSREEKGPYWYFFVDEEGDEEEDDEAAEYEGAAQQ